MFWQNDDTTAAAIPESGAGLRRILFREVLQTWLPGVLCSAQDPLLPSPTTSGASSSSSSQEERDCVEEVEGALRGSGIVPNVSVTAMGVKDVAVTTR